MRIEENIGPDTREVLRVAVGLAEEHTNALQSDHILLGFLTVEGIPAADVFQKYLDIEAAKKKSTIDIQTSLNGSQSQKLYFESSNLKMSSKTRTIFMRSGAEAMRRGEPIIGAVALGLGLIRTVNHPDRGIAFTPEVKEGVARQWREQTGKTLDLSAVPEEPHGIPATRMIEELGVNPTLIELELVQLD